MKKYLLAFAIALMPLSSALADTPTQTVIDYYGELIDQKAAPVSGVLPLEFRIYADRNGKKTIATEKHFIAVVDGNYFVSLGEQTEIKSTAEKLYVAVLLDGKELTRQEVAIQRQIVASQPKVVKTSPAGSEDGEHFKRECPAGYVVTGIEGNVKDGINGLRLICSQVVKL